MSTNEIDYDVTEPDLSKESCLDLETNNKVKLYERTKGYDDECYIDVHLSQSMGPGNYKLYNNYHCEEHAKKVSDISNNNPYVFIKNGHGVSRKNIDGSTELRIGKTKENPKCPQQLFHRPYKTTPFKGKGLSTDRKDKDLKKFFNTESNLLQGELTHDRRECNVLSGVTIPHFFTPLVPHLKDNVQNPEHLIEEIAEDGWIRGGAPSRLIIRDVDYLQRCGYSHMNKTANEDFWEEKHMKL